MKDNQFVSHLLIHHSTAIRFLELLINKIELLEELLAKIKNSRFSKNLEVINLYDII